MTDNERKEVQAALALVFLELVQSRQPETEARQAAHLLTEHLDALDRRIESLADDVARLQGWEG